MKENSFTKLFMGRGGSCICQWEVFLYGRIIQTQYYSEQCYCYVVSETEEKAVVSDLDEQHVQPLHLRFLHSLDSTVIVPKHNIYKE